MPGISYREKKSCVTDTILRHANTSKIRICNWNVFDKDNNKRRRGVGSCHSSKEKPLFLLGHENLCVLCRNDDKLMITHVAPCRQWPTFHSEPALTLDKELSKLLCNEQLDLQEIVNLLYKDDDFLFAAETGDVDALQKMLSKGVDIHKRDYMGRNALHLAVCSGNAEAIALLLAAKVEPNVKDNIGMTPLSLCLMRNPSLKLVKLLFAHGAVILPRTALYSGLFLEYAMMCSGTRKDAKILALLLEKGALINDPDAPGQRQALHFAAMSNNCDLIRILAHLGANLYATNHRGETPRQVAITYRCREAQAMLEELEALDKKSRENAARRSVNLTRMVKTHPSVNWGS